MKALILAAGYAMRLYPLTKDTPKALLPIGGRKMIDFLMDQICAVPEIDETVIVTNHRFASQFSILYQQYDKRKCHAKQYRN